MNASPDPSTIRIVLADDHPVYRDGLRDILDGEPSFEMVAEAGDGRRALAVIRERNPDVALLDIDMPLRDGMEVARACAQEKSPCRLIFLTMHRDEAILEEALSLGDRGYVLKDSAAREIVEAVKVVAGGSDYLGSVMTGLLRKRSRPPRTRGGMESLAASEKKVLRLIASGRTSKEIARDLGLSPRTVENHRSRLCEKLGLAGVHSLVKFAIDHKDAL